MNPEVRLGVELAKLDARVDELERSRRLNRTTLVDGALEVSAEDGTVKQIIGKQYDNTFTVLPVSGPVPPTPTAPKITASALQLVITWDGMFPRNDTFPYGTAPADFARIEVHLSQAGANFVPDLVGPNSTTLAGSVESPRGGRLTVTPLSPNVTYYAKLVCRTQSGVPSVASASASASPLPPPDPPDAATVKPDQPIINTIASNIRGLVVYVNPVPASTLLDYLVDGVPTLLNQRTGVVTLETNAAGQPMADDDPATTYAITVRPHNAAGVGPDSEPVTAMRDPGVNYEQVVDTVVASRIKSGGVQVGETMTLSPDPDRGFTFTTGAGDIFIRRLGSRFLGALAGSAVSIAESLTWLTGSMMRGVGTLSAGLGIPPAPNVAHTWTAPEVALGWNASGYGAIRGLVDDGTRWLTVETKDNGSTVLAIDKTTGAVSTLIASPTSWCGITRIGANWYVLGKSRTSVLRSYISIFDSSWTALGTLGLDSTDGGAGKSSPTSQALGTDGTYLFHIRRYRSADTTKTDVRSYTVDGTLRSLFTLVDAGAEISDIEVTGADLGATRFIVSTETGGIRVYSTAGANIGQRVTDQEWDPAANVPAMGLVWDGTRFHSVTQTTVYHYSRITVDIARSVRYAYYRAAPEAESVAGQAAAITQKKRWWLGAYVSQPSPPASAARFYVGNALQPSNGPLTMVFESVVAGSAPPTTSTFVGGEGIAAWVSETVADATLRPLTMIAGDGKVRMSRYQQTRRLTFNSAVAADTAATPQVFTFSPAFDGVPTISLSVGVSGAASAKVQAHWIQLNNSQVTVTVRRVDGAISSTAPVFVDVVATYATP